MNPDLLIGLIQRGRTAPSGGASCIWWPMAIEQKHLDRAIALAKTYGATRLILFGSALRHPDQARDLDLACDGVVGWKLYELGARLSRYSGRETPCAIDS